MTLSRPNSHRRILLHGLTSCLALLLLSVSITFGQEKNPQRGFQPGNSYALSDIETINTTNGNLMLNFLLGKTASGRGGLSGGISLWYNSKLYDSDVTEITDGSGQESSQNYLITSQKGAWNWSSPLSYYIEFINRNTVEGGGHAFGCTGTSSLDNKRAVYLWKVKMAYPDGSEHEFRPTGYTDILLDGYFNVDPSTGEIRDVSISCLDAQTCACNYGTVGYAPNQLIYFSTDGSYTRLTINRGVGWTLSFPDGNQIVSLTGGSNYSAASYSYDRNNNYLTNGLVTLPNGHTVGALVDQFGRYVAHETNLAAREDYIYSLGFNNQTLMWTVKWKSIYVLKPYTTTAATGGRQRGNTSDQTYQGEAVVVDRITLPSQIGNLSYQFSYNAPDYVPGSPEPTTESPGWGEVSGITFPSGAQVSYQYARDGSPSHKPNTRNVMDNFVRQKTLTYQAEYDGNATPVTDTWSYGVGHTGSSITAPDGGVITHTFNDVTWPVSSSGLVYKETNPAGEVVERNWQPNSPPGIYGSLPMNYYVKTEFRSIPNAAGTLVWTAIKDYSYDKNGNPTSEADYDLVPYSSAHPGGGAPSLPAGLTPSRVTVTAYNNPTPDATNSSSDSSNAYWNPSAPTLRSAASSTEVRNGSGLRFARSEFSYDNPSTTGNLTQKMSWDSTKGPVNSSSPYLTTANSISISNQYANWSSGQTGKLIQTTDGRGTQTSLTYDSVGGFDLYPTQIQTAYGTSVQRTEQRQFDFSSGLVIHVTDTDNNVSMSTTYDEVGRPTLVKAAEGRTEETRTRTAYDDTLRRVIVFSDLNTVSDEKLVTVKHYDQLGRVRLTRQLEDSTTQSATDETTGIKVQARYLYSGSNSYQLVSNPYCAATSAAAGSEQSMGWIRSMSDNGGRTVEVQTFGGATVPAPWGTNVTSTGTVTTTYDANQDGYLTTVTDQANKARRSVTNGLGELIRIDEPDAINGNLDQNNLPVQSTSYTYDALSNLLTVHQGSQARSFTYDSLSRLRTAFNPESGTISYSYDDNGNLTQKTDARPVTTNYVYDELNRPKSRAYSDGTPTINYGYDANGVPNSKGRLTAIGSTVSSYSYSEYDALGRPKIGAQATNGQTYSMHYGYNLAGGMTSQTYPSGRTISTEVDGAGRIAGIRDHGFYFAGGSATDVSNRMQYSPAGVVSAMRLGNGLWQHTNLNTRLQVTQIGLGTAIADSSSLKLDYSYGVTVNGVLDQTKNNGNVQSLTITEPGLQSPILQTYQYDYLNRLGTAHEVGANGWTQNFTYDLYGNRTGVVTNDNPSSRLPTVAPVVDPSTNRLQKFDAQNQSTGYDYDNAGNLTQEPKAASLQEYVYDAENHVIQAKTKVGTTETEIAHYEYDGDGRRVKKVMGANVSVYVYDVTGQLIEEYSTDSPNASENRNYITEDMLGTPRVITGSGGQIKERHDYLPFGEEIPAAYSNRNNVAGYGADNLRQKFTSKERDNETGLDYFLARYYSSTQGRFTSPDEFTGGPSEIGVLGSGHPEKQALKYAEVTNPQSLNKYQYCFNNPLRYIDPDGQEPQTGGDLNFERDEREFLAGHISEQEFRSRMNARGVGAIAGLAILVTAYQGVEAATALLVWAVSHPEQVEQVTLDLHMASTGSPAPGSPGTLTLSSATRLSVEEANTGSRLAAQLGEHLTESTHVGEEFVSAAGRTYDAMGGSRAYEYFGNGTKFFKSIVRHVNKSAEYTAIDLTGASRSQIAAIEKYVSTLSKEQQAKIIYVR